MFTTLGGIFKGQPPRQAEQTDTRLGIQRHDPDHHRRKSKSKEEGEDAAAEEGATVTVPALQEFLVKLLTSRAPAQNTADQTEMFSPENGDTLGETAPTTRSAQSSMAASAYQQTARSAQQKQVLLETTDNSAGGPEFDLSAVDTRTIQALLADLKILNEAGIEYLHIERAETFLQSLVNATVAAKSSLV